MSGISFKNVTFKYDGNEHIVEITGTLPQGVTVSYENNKGTNAGTYNAVAIFIYDEDNYNEILNMNAVLTINKDKQSYVNPETNKEDVIVSSEEGIDPNKNLKVELVETEISNEKFNEFLNEKQKVAIAYDVKLIQNGVEVQPDGTLKIKILIPEKLKDREFSIIHIHNDDEFITLDYEIDGEYIIVYTNQLSEFVFVYKMGSLLWLIIVLTVIVVLEAVLLVFLMKKKKQMKGVKLASAYPPFIFGMFVPEWQIILIVILVALVVILAVVDVIYAISILNNKDSLVDEYYKKEVDFNNEEVVDEIVEEKQETISEQVVNEVVDEEDDETISVWDEETHSYTIIRIIKSFTARLSQSTNESKNYYDNIKNELMSYKNVKSRISFKYETFKVGRNNIARLRFRGKTLCLYLALNPADYENTKYKVEDMSGISSSSEVPTMYRINLPRRANYAKELIFDLM